MIEVNNIDDFKNLLLNNRAVLAYFSHNNCNVCKTLKPKLSKILKQDFPFLKQVYVNVEQQSKIATDYQVFTVPVVLVFFDNKEHLRKVRTFGISEITDPIKRVYNILY